MTTRVSLLGISVLIAVLIALGQALADNPDSAVAEVRGGPLAPDIEGTVTFEAVEGGTMVTVEVWGLPDYEPGDPEAGVLPIGPHGFHVHAGTSCELGDPDSPFMDAEGHFDLHDMPHGAHAGDLPVLFSNDGYAFMTVFTNNFEVSDVIGRTIIIHQNPDDFRSQPAGDAGPRLACGEIVEGS